MTQIKIDLPKKLEIHFNNLEVITKKPREYHIKEVLIRYLEDMEDFQDIEKHIKNKDKAKYYTTEELEKKLGI